MGLEITGFTRSNLEKLWIDPKAYQSQLKEAVKILDQGKMTVSIYNHQLCVLDKELHPFSHKSISDWKNEFMPECDGCTRRATAPDFSAPQSCDTAVTLSHFGISIGSPECELASERLCGGQW